MDFKDIPSAYESLLPLEIIEVETSSYEPIVEFKDDNWDLASDNEHLIEKCIESKRTDILDLGELYSYGRMALYTAAQDFIHGLDFEEFALKRIEKHMNVAITEELFRKSPAYININKIGLQTEFQSIYKRFP